MKAVKILSLLTIFLISSQLNASHLLGGEITWKAIAQNQYIFYMKVYRDCNGVNFQFNQKQLDVNSTVLPIISNGNIVLRPDSAKWLLLNQGDLSPSYSCDTMQTYKCSNADLGAIRVFPFQSDTIQLLGNPPNDGWTFTYRSNCCISNSIVNLSPNGTSTIALKAKMYVNGVNNTYSSPEFLSLPKYDYCYNISNRIQNSIEIGGLDSISYHFDRVLHADNTPMNYQTNYSPSSPTPNASHHSFNTPLSLDTSSGEMSFKAMGGGLITYYYVVLRLDSWKSGVKVNSVYREFPIGLFNCGSVNGNVKATPEIVLPNSAVHGIHTYTVQAGSVLNLPVKVKNPTTNFGQPIVTRFEGEQFATDFSTVLNCQNPTDSSCAIVFPFPQQNSVSNRYELTGQDSVDLNMIWQTNCDHLGLNNTEKSYYFAIEAFTDNCPIAASSKKLIKVKVQPNCTLTSMQELVQKQNDYVVYPNPSSGQLFLQLRRAESIQVTVRNVEGKLIQIRSFNNQQKVNFNLPKASGIYFIEIVNQAGERSFRKVVKQ